MPQTVSVNELTDIVARIFVRHGLSQDNVAPVAETVAAAERDGSLSHGLLRLPGYVATLKSGWVDGPAVPVVYTTSQFQGSPRKSISAGRRAVAFPTAAIHARSPMKQIKTRAAKRAWFNVCKTDVTWSFS
jgi:LDH2 family malate/lactate/ureidoglycolate dehydrogenase